LQKFAATIEKGDLVAVSGPIYPQSFAGKSGKVETYAIRANTLEMLKRKNASTSDAQDEAAAEVEDGIAG
jgi:single-stranded DNA-binding protein